MSADSELGGWSQSSPLRFALRTPTLPPATTTNTLIVGEDRLVIIEPATPHGEEQRRLDLALDHLRALGRTVVGIALTHHHRDHIGYAEALRRRLGVPLYAHPATADRLPFSVDVCLDDGQSIDLGEGRRLLAVHTPGHAPGHLVFVDEAHRIAHVGDMVAGEGTVLIDPDDAGEMGAYLDSLAKLRALDLEQLIPAHGPPIDHPAPTIDALVAHRLERERKVIDTLERGCHAMPPLLAAVYDDKPTSVWPIALLSLRAHLAKLVQDGRVVMDGDHARLAD